MRIYLNSAKILLQINLFCDTIERRELAETKQREICGGESFPIKVGSIEFMREIICLNDGWDFCSDKADLRKKKLPKKMKIEKVNLPHIIENVGLEKFTVKSGKMSYRRVFDVTANDANKSFFLEFEGVMHELNLFVNGKKIQSHYGGYDCFAVDITKYVNFPSSKTVNRPIRNSIVLSVDNRVEPDLPIGKPSDAIDFMYYGGVYRNVKLIKTESVRISNPFLNNSDSDDGICIFNDTVTREFALIGINVSVENKANRAQKIRSVVNVYDMDNNAVAQFSSKELTVKKGAKKLLNIAVRHDLPRFWAPSHPYLYSYVIDVIANGQRVDSQCIRRGIRTASVDHRGFVLNGARTYLRGIVRHDQMPYIGNALSDEAEYRDAFRIKKAGFNLVKTGYYPTSKAFIDACDELGLLVLNVVPGYQHMQKGDFVELFKRNISSLVRRDRNSTSVVLWQATPSETSKVNASGATDKCFSEFNDVLRGELLYGERPLIAGDTVGRKKPLDLKYDAPYCESDYLTKKKSLSSMPGHKGLVSDYGDYEFGANKSVCHVDRSDEGKMLLQAWCMQWQHNRNRGSRSIMGDVLTEAFDHTSASQQGLARSGIMDAFRLPKFSCEFFRSQDERKGAKNVFIPTYWNDERINKLVVYSNCDSVKLYINNEFVEERTPDNGVTRDYKPFDKKSITAREKSIRMALKGKTNIASRHWALPVGLEVKAARISPIVYHMTDTIYTGGDCDRLSYPPFTFDEIEYASGEVRAVGYVNGVAVCQHSVKTAGAPHAVKIKIDYSNRALNNDGSDVIIAHAEVVDAEGVIVRDKDFDIEFNISGGEFVGDAQVRTEAGIASTLLRAVRGAESVEIEAKSEGLAGQRVGVSLNKTVQVD